MHKLTVEKALEIAKNKDKARFAHVYSTYKKATYLAKKYQVKNYQCQIAALLHDYAKNEPYDEMVHIIKNHLNIELLQYDKIIYHGEVGAYLVSKRFGIEDKDIIGAIKYHVTGHPLMNDIGKVIYVADFTEDNRNQLGVEFCRYLSEISLDLAVLGCANLTHQYLIASKNKNIHPLTKGTYDKFMEKVGNEYEVIKNSYKRM